MRTLALVLGTALLSAPALAADNELSIELGTFHNGDTDFGVFSDGEYMPSWGLRLGVAPLRNLAVVGGWHRVRRGADLYIDDWTHIGRAAFFADEFTLGVRGDVMIGQALLPYAMVQGLGMVGRVKFDDDPDDKGSPGQFAESAVAVGGLAVAGVELRIPKGNAPFTLAWHIEAGYGLTSALDFERTGDMTPRGFVLRSGVGVRF